MGPTPSRTRPSADGEAAERHPQRAVAPVSSLIFAAVSIVVILSLYALSTAASLAFSRESRLEVEPLDPVMAVFATITAAVLVLYRVAVPVVAAWGIAIVVSRRTQRLSFRFAEIAGATAVASVAMGALLTGLFRDAEGSELALWLASSALMGAVTGALAVSPWRGGIASRRLDDGERREAESHARPRVAAAPDDHTPRPYRSPLGFVIVSIGAAAAAGWMVVVAFFATVALPQRAGSQDSWFAGDIVWIALLGIGASATVAVPFVAAATGFGYLARSLRTLPARILVIVGGVTLTSAAFAVPLALAIAAPVSVTLSIVALCAAVGLALAGGALGPWRFGFAAAPRPSSPHQSRRPRTRKGRTPKDAAPLSLWSELSDWND